MTTARTLVLLPCLLAAALLAAPAFADVAAPPPESCPGGGIPSTDHYGGYCSVSACSSDADCWYDQVCRPASLCVASRLFEHPRGNTSRSEVVAQCPNQAPCPGGAVCSTGLFCATPDAKLTEPPVTKGASRQSPTPTPVEPDELKGPGRCALVGSSGIGLLALGLVLVAARRVQGGRIR